MATAELSSPSPAGPWSRPGSRWRLWLCGYLLVWGITLLAGVTVLCAGRPLVSLTRQVLGLHLSPHQNAPPTLAHALALAAHNLPVVAWPLLIGLTGADRHPLGRRVADVAVVAWLVANTAPVGAAITAYGVPLLAYLPQVPFEWAALAVGAASWATQRQGRLGNAERIGWLAVAAGLIMCAAALESVVVPHR